ncbi:MAG: DUF4136 domain-containing protein [Desulfocapsa sp.]|nr:DUF4136 domain-containing protein [Desulfocapsa sp.]
MSIFDGVVFIPLKGGLKKGYKYDAIIIDILDPVEHKLIWRGSGQDRIRGKKNPEEVKKGLLEAVKAIMKDFPPEK